MVISAFDPISAEDKKLEATTAAAFGVSTKKSVFVADYFIYPVYF